MDIKKNVIACKIFKNEIEQINVNDPNVLFHWLNAALHANPDKMEEEISELLTRINPDEDTRFLFGNGCHPDMCKLAQKAGTGMPSEKNCIHAFLGAEQAKELEKDRTLIISPGWIDAWEASWKAWGGIKPIFELILAGMTGYCFWILKLCPSTMRHFWNFLILFRFR